MVRCGNRRSALAQGRRGGYLCVQRQMRMLHLRKRVQSGAQTEASLLFQACDNVDLAGGRKSSKVNQITLRERVVRGG